VITTEMKKGKSQAGGARSAGRGRKKTREERDSGPRRRIGHKKRKLKEETCYL